MNTSKFTRFFRSYLALILIFLLALTLRVYRLGSLPYGLHEDEVMNGYVGRYILQNGKDLYNNRWPLLYFNNFGDYPNVIPMYLSGVSTYIFGVNAFAIRFPIALAGALTVFPVFYISKYVFTEKKYTLFTSFCLAILPWHIMLSRSTAENVTATFIYLAAIVWLIDFFKTSNKKSLGITIILSALTYFLYPSYRIVIPLTFFTISCLSFRLQKKARTFAAIGILFLFITFGISRTFWGQGRFRQTSLFYFNNMVVHRLETYSFGIGAGHGMEARIFYNKPVGFTREFIHQTLSYFSPTFLFTDAGKPDRYRLSDTGIMYLAFLLIIVIGIGTELFSKNRENHLLPAGKTILLFLMTCLLVSVIPAALTLDDVPNLHRALPIGIFMLFFITYCFTHIKKYLYLPIFVLLLLESVYFWHQWTAYGPVDQAPFRDQGRIALADYLKTHHQQYDAVYLSKTTKVLYYLLANQNFNAELAGTFSYNIYADRVDNLHYVDENCVTEHKNLPITTKSLIVDGPECEPTGPYYLKTFDTLKRIDTQIAFNLQTATMSGSKK